MEHNLPSVVWEVDWMDDVLSWHTGTQSTETCRGTIILLMLGLRGESDHQLYITLRPWAAGDGERENVWEMKCERDKTIKLEEKLERRWWEQRGKTMRRETNSGRTVRLHRMSEMFVLVLLHDEPRVKSRLLASPLRTSLLAGFINRPLYFLRNPQRAYNSLKEKSGTQNYWGGEGL